MALHKQGLDYYAHSIGMTTGVRMSSIRRLYGSVGVDVWLTLLDLIYKDRGYYLPYSQFERSDVLWEISGRLRGKDSPDEETVGKIIDELIHEGFFDLDMVGEGILTSVQIQEQFYLSTLKRKHVEIEQQYWLLSIARMTILAKKSPILLSMLAE